jgi:lipopolysaccharide/colanic/teichoic acid biosynthesis glycosyltransferase
MRRISENQILPRSLFLDRLRVEKRRSDRSKSSISIALFCFDGGKEEHFQQITNLLVSLRKNTRETDVIGWVDHDSIGLLLPDTNVTGTQKCVDKIVNGNGRLSCSVVTGTYPDHLFQQLLDDDQAQPDLFPLYLEESVESAGFQSALKRGIDVAGSFVGLLFLCPLIMVTALCIKGTSPGPVIFKQTRLGQRCTRFAFYKFRSMYCGTDDQIHRKYVENLIKGNLDEINQGEKEKPLYKIKTDPRVTRVGKIIRKLSIDEIPQLYNVLKGEMSLVGPRPPLPYEVEKYEPWHLRRILEVKPGITGLWQVEGRSKTSFNDMVRLDLRYVQNWSLGLDLKILVKTVKAVLKPTGAL